MLLSDTAIAILATFLAFLSHRIESLLSYTPVWHRFHFRGLSFIVTFWSHGFLSVVCFQSTFGHSKYSFFHMNFRTIYSNSAMFVLFFLTGSTADGIKQLTSLSYWAILLKKKAWALIYKVFYSLPLSLSFSDGCTRLWVCMCPCVCRACEHTCVWRSEDNFVFFLWCCAYFCLKQGLTGQKFTN